VHQVGWLLK